MFRKLTKKMKEGVLDTSRMSTSSTASTTTVNRKPFKVVLIGDSQCGKSSLLKRYTKKAFSEDYVPTVFDSGTAEIVAEQNNDVKLNIWDTSGSSEFDHIRPLSFSESSVFVLCFDLEKPSASLENVQKKWLPEIRKCHSDKPIVVVGCKADLRGEMKNMTKKNLLCHQGMLFAKEIDAVAYLECSSKSEEGAFKIDKLFNTTALISTGQLQKIPKEMRPRDPKKEKPECCLM